MNSKTMVGFIVVFLLFIVSCNSQSGVAQTPISTVSPNITTSQIATATLNFTVTPSITLSPREVTQTASYPTFIVSKQTQEHYMFTAVPATLEARNAKCQEGFVLVQYLDVIRYSNNEWTLITCSPIPANKNDLYTPGNVDYGTRYTQLVKTDLSKTWTIQHNTFDYSIIDRPDALLAPFRWTKDGKYLYLYPVYFPGGSGFPQSAILYTHINNLYRINLENGYFDLVLRSDEFGALDISPDDKFLAYSEDEKTNVVHIRNLENGSDFKITIDEDIVAAGAFVWSLDSTKVVFFVGYEKQSDNWQDDLSGTAIFVLNPQNMNVRKVLAKDIRIFEPYGCSDNHDVWLDENTICLYSVNHELDSWNKFFSFNIKTGEVKYLYSWGEEFPTSTPTP